VADLPTQRDFDDFAAWSGRDVVAPDGNRLGAVDVIFLDEATGVPEWVLVRLDDGTAFVPLVGATVEERSIRVEQARERVESAPAVEVGETLSVGDEKRLYEHYGLTYSREESSTVLPEGTSAEPEERPRLRKYVGAPVPAPASEEPAAPGAEQMAPRNLSSATPSPLPPAAPRVIPPEGGFQSLEEQGSGSRMRLAIPAVLAGALAGLIAVLAWRRRS
jgi:PRC-barrel domain protein